MPAVLPRMLGQPTTLPQQLSRQQPMPWLNRPTSSGHTLRHPRRRTAHQNLLISAAHPKCYFQLFTNGLALTPKPPPAWPAWQCHPRQHRRTAGGPTHDAAATMSSPNAPQCPKLQSRLDCSPASPASPGSTSLNWSQRTTSTLVRKGVHYIWYYIYRPAGAHPEPENALTREQIRSLRHHRRPAALGQAAHHDAYWDHQGNALCPGPPASPHIAPPAPSICPPVQFARSRRRPTTQGHPVGTLPSQLRPSRPVVPAAASS